MFHFWGTFQSSTREPDDSNAVWLRQIIPTVVILEENIFQSVSPRCDMVQRASVLQSQRSSRARSLDDNVGT